MRIRELMTPAQRKERKRRKQAARDAYVIVRHLEDVLREAKKTWNYAEAQYVHYSPKSPYWSEMVAKDGAR